MSVSICHAIHSDHSRIADWLLLNGTLTSCPGLSHGKLGIDYLIRSGLIEVDEDFFDDRDEQMYRAVMYDPYPDYSRDEGLIGYGWYWLCRRANAGAVK